MNTLVKLVAFGSVLVVAALAVSGAISSMPAGYNSKPEPQRVPMPQSFVTFPSAATTTKAPPTRRSLASNPQSRPGQPSRPVDPAKLALCDEFERNTALALDELERELGEPITDKQQLIKLARTRFHLLVILDEELYLSELRRFAKPSDPDLIRFGLDDVRLKAEAQEYIRGHFEDHLRFDPSRIHARLTYRQGESVGPQDRPDKELERIGLKPPECGSSMCSTLLPGRFTNVGIRQSDVEAAAADVIELRLLVTGDGQKAPHRQAAMGLSFVWAPDEGRWAPWIVTTFDPGSAIPEPTIKCFPMPLY